MPKQKVPGTSELLIVSPMIPKYTVHNRYLNTSTTVTVEGFDARSLQETIPSGAAAYVQSVRVSTPNSDVTMQNASRCYFDFYDTFRVGADITITVTADRNAANSCGVSVPQSISTGGFAMARWKVRLGECVGDALYILSVLRVYPLVDEMILL
jgi:hypothetical protein